jgi:hypothetical protein
MFLNETNNNRDLHKNNENIPDEYKSLSLHIALERADKKKDWKAFREIYKISPIALKNHLNMTSIFGYNYLKLSQEEVGFLTGLSRQRTNMALKKLESLD